MELRPAYARAQTETSAPRQVATGAQEEGVSRPLACWRPMGNRAPGPGRRSALRGRASECAVLDDLVVAIRRGESRSLVLRGEAGIGKTALIECLVESAADLTVVRAVGVESDMELAFASLHQ